MTRIGIKVSVPFLNNQDSSSELNDLKSHMLGWYDVKRQGCTNESLAENPVLEDLSGKNHPLELKNFAFGGLSGMGGYGTDLTKWAVQGGATLSEKTPHKVTVHLDDTVVGYKASFRFQNDDKERYDYFKIRTSVPGNMTYSLWENVSNTLSCYSEDKMTFEVYGKGIYRATFIPDNGVLDYTLEILPNFPNSLVFNGVTPEYVINRYNVTLNNVVTAIGVNKFKFESNGRITKYIRGSAGQPLNVSVPSFIVRVTGFQKEVGVDKHIQINILDNVNSGNKYHMIIRGDGTYIIPQTTYTVEPTDETIVPIAQVDVRAYNFLTDDEYEIEFFPNYPTPTTTNYGQITTIPANTVKCMMMNFVPLAGNNYESWYYCQRGGNASRDFAIVNYGGSDPNTDISKIRAYIARNSIRNTYINGKINKTATVLDLVQKNQVVSINTSSPQHNTIYLRWDAGTYRNTPQMALNSLILFDRELTEEEMKLVMDKLMKYEDTDNIAGNLSRSANVLSLDDSDMYEEYDVYEEGQEIIESPVEFNDNTV